MIVLRVRYDIDMRILQVRHGEAKLFDLKFATTGCILSESFEGATAYMSPEMLSCKEYTQKTDIYSVAICLWELWYGRPVYSRPYILGHAHLLKSVTDGRRPSCDCRIAMPPALQATVSDCWKVLSDQRPEANQVAIEIRKIK